MERVPVTFKLTHPCSFGDVVKVVGNVPQLGGCAPPLFRSAALRHSATVRRCAAPAYRTTVSDILPSCWQVGGGERSHAQLG